MVTVGSDSGQQRDLDLLVVAVHPMTLLCSQAGCLALFARRCCQSMAQQSSITIMCSKDRGPLLLHKVDNTVPVLDPTAPQLSSHYG